MQSGPFQFFFCASILIALSGPVFAQAPDSSSGLNEEQRMHIALEALSRMQNLDVAKNPELKATIDKLLTRTRGTPQFLQLVQQLKLKDQNEGLLELARRFPSRESGVESTRLLLNNDPALLKRSLGENDAAKIVEALGNTAMKEAMPLLLPLVTAPERDLALRKQAVRSAAQTEDGAAQILELARRENLPADLRLTAASELSRVRWEKIKSEAATVLPLPQGHDAQPLPEVSELVKMKGDASQGAVVFFRTETQCGTCHKVQDRGGDIGPALTEIGTKLGKDALFESILDPGAGISFGYEAYQVDLKSGDEAFGLIVSETADELVMKDLKGIVTHHKKSEVARRQPLKTSLMPAGLQQTMSTQDLVDLVEFLSTLRKTE